MLRARYRRIVLFFARVLISLVFWNIVLPRLGLRKWSQRTRSKRLKRIATQFRALAIRMGGVLIKVGQFLSARVDVLPGEITAELAGLQDEVPEENFSDIRHIIEAEFGVPIQAKFLEFEVVPVAAASLGQVHQARINLDDPTLRGANAPRKSRFLNVVVKVQRPNIEKILDTDLAALRTVGNWLHRYRPISQRADIPALLDEFTRILYEEIDYLAEGKNAETFAANFIHRPGVRVPAVIWPYTTKRVLTLEDVQAIKITEYEQITAAGIDRAEVAERLFQTYLQQIFEDGFFHADPHPGNLFVSPHPDPTRTQKDAGIRRGEANNFQLTFVDFGMVGRVPQNLRAGIREMAIAVGTQDAARMVKSFQLMGLLLPHADLELLEKAEAKAFEHFWGKNMSELKEISFQEMHEFTHEFRDLIYTMPFQIPQDMILLGRSIAILSGMCTGLNPEFNFWEGLEPFAQKLILEEATTNLSVWFDEFKKFASSLLSYPKRIDAILNIMETGELSVHVPQFGAQVTRLERTLNRMTGGVVFAALFIGGIQLWLAGEDIIGRLLIVAACLALVWTLFR